MDCTVNLFHHRNLSVGSVAGFDDTLISIRPLCLCANHHAHSFRGALLSLVSHSLCQQKLGSQVFNKLDPAQGLIVHHFLPTFATQDNLCLV